MAKYKVYFEIYGKKMKTTVEAKTAEQAKELIRNKIQFNHIALDDLGKLEDFDFLKDESAINMMKDFLKGFNGK